MDLIGPPTSLVIECSTKLIRAVPGASLSALHRRYKDSPTVLRRTRAGRDLSRDRLDNAEAFLHGLEARRWQARILFYQSGIVAQLALSAHLLDVGFDDEWCASNLGLDVSKALAYADATGLRCDNSEMARLASVLSPYWKWNQPARWNVHELDDGGFSTGEIGALLRQLLEQVYHVTGHNRPKQRRFHLAEKGDRA